MNGGNYNFEIVSKNGGKDCCFFIRAVCKFTGRTSCINNLNTVLSELDVEAQDPKFADSMWVVSKKEAHEFVKTSNKILSNLSFLKYLERRLNEDREAGEWEHLIKARS